jgi:hypothetical protein
MSKKLLIIIVILVIVLAGFAFFWYEWRPAKIKHDCSWVKRHSDPIPERLPKSQEEIDACKKECSGQPFCCLAFSLSHPAIPEKNWWEEASPEEYIFCIHEKGL